MHLKDILPSAHIRCSDSDTPVETSRPEDRGIKYIYTVGGREHDDPLVHAKTVHLNEQLIKCLLPLVVAAAHAGTPAPCDRVYLIYENYGRCIFLRILKQIPHTRSSDTDEHLNEIRTRYREKRYSRLARDSLCKQRLTCSGRAR